MATKIITKNSSTTTAIPTAGDLVQGELAVNVTDKRLFTENSGGTIVELGTAPSTIAIIAGTIDGTVIGGTTAAAGSFTSGTFSGNIEVNSATVSIVLNETDIPNKNTQLLHATGDFRIRTRSDDALTNTDRFRIDHGTGDISFYEDTGTTAKFFWDASAESLGIGTSSPDSLLEIAGPDESQLKVTGASGVEVIARASASTGSIGTNTAHNLYIRTGNTARITVDGTTGAATFTGNLIMAAGGGIDFSANGNAAGMTSELLDDYEEGTFTPTWVGGSVSGNHTYTTQAGFYTKVGNLVSFHIRLTLLTKGTIAGSLTLGGLPFPSLGTTSSNGQGGVSYAILLSITAGTSLGVVLDLGAATALMKYWDSTGGASALDASALTNTSQMFIHGTYRTT